MEKSLLAMQLHVHSVAMNIGHSGLHGENLYGLVINVSHLHKRSNNFL